MSVWRHISVLAGIMLVFLLHVPPITAQCEATEGSLGGIDDNIILRYFRMENRSLTDVYVRDGGLYLLPSSVTAEGSVERICVLGHFNARFLSLILDEKGGIDPQTTTRPFVYVLHYRPLSEDLTTYEMVNKTALVYHDTAKGCIYDLNGLNWQVQRGDKLGVFIPDNCSSWDQLRASTAVDVFSTQFGIDLLCPSQINLVVDEVLRRDSSLCKYAYYLNVSLSDISVIRSEQFIREETVLNIEVTIDEDDKLDAVVIPLVTILVAILVATVVILGLIVAHRTRKSRKLQLQINEAYATAPKNTNEPTRPAHDYNTLEPPTNHYDLGPEDNGSYSSPYEHEAGAMTLKATKDTDYDEPYFEPASKVEELFDQLMTLDVPSIEKEHLSLHEMLGSGAFGTVYRGVWLHKEGEESEQLVEEEVAVKTMEGGASEEDRIKFLQEAAIMGQFNHPNIIQLLGISTEGELMIVVDLMKGDLRQHLLKLKEQCESKRVPAELSPTLLSFTRQVAFGMLYLSNKSFVHRDLAARNILLSHDRTTCKIADFGLSRDLQKETFYISHGGKIPVKWTAPEALNYRTYSTASDVWSYGCVLYEIWSLGHKPFQELENSKVTKQLSSGYRLPPPPGCPKSIYDIMIKCWNHEVSERPSFCDIVVPLQLPDFQILKWSAADEAKYSLPTRTLGSDIEKGHGLYPELQSKYLRKIVRREISKESVDCERSSNDEVEQTGEA